MGSVPNHHDQVNIAIKRVAQIFLVSHASKSSVYTPLYSIQCAIPLGLKNQKCAYLDFKTFIAKKRYPSSEPSAGWTLFAGGGSYLQFVNNNAAPAEHNEVERHQMRYVRRVPE